MRVRTRLVVGFCGLALSAPAAIPAWAAPQDGQPAAPGGPTGMPPYAGGAPVLTLQQVGDAQPSAGTMPPMTGPLTGMAPSMGMAPGMGMAPSPGMAPGMAGPAPARVGHMANNGAAPAHHHHGFLGRRHCVECQRARAKAADGIDVPPPPGYAGAPMLAPGETIVSGPTVVSERVVSVNDPQAAGHAVVGGEDTAGYAVVGGQPGAGADPTPIGVARGAYGAAATDPRMAQTMRRPGGGAFDPAVMPTSIPAAPTPMSGPGHNRPHVIGHVLGLPMLGKLHEQREAKKRQEHAAISYGDGSKVTEIPASMVYGNR